MGIAIGAYTLKGDILNSEYKCPIEKDAERLGLVLNENYAALECEDYLSIRFSTYIEFREYLVFIGNELGEVVFDKHFYSVEGVITNEECHDFYDAFINNEEKIKAITWEKYGFATSSGYHETEEEFAEDVLHETKRAIQQDQAILNRQMRVFTNMLKFAVEKDGFIDYG